MSDAWLLALETSGSAGSVALARRGQLLAEQRLPGERRNAAELLPCIAEMLAKERLHVRDLTFVAFSAGPGSFTGVRVAATVARMLSSVAGLKVIRTPTLHVLAQGASLAPNSANRILAMLDAKRSRVYAAAFEQSGTGLCEVLAAGEYDWDALCQAVSTTDCAWCAVGDGIRRHRDQVAAAGIQILPEECWRPRAAMVAELAWRMAAAGRITPPAEIVPIYIRPPECEQVYEQRREAAKARRAGATPGGGAT
ncbi:MAG: tRNA (adenosine(37)-N6)-threonylcarbamoyltransferase complex dimerization subunit type 1 TsaB [Planctomycetes bacterium]|nr:tRNA (adenosine(37)-N6)-threonylcarbamoyltransferase complex dimerization subunit type 1 TsaB [Planctomycetota bacterium]